MAFTTLLLVRHAHVADNDRHDGARLCGWWDPPLSLLGQAQNQRLARRLARATPPDALYASPLGRARVTARALAAVWHRRVRYLDDLREVSCGELEGMPLRDVRRRYPLLWQRNLAQADKHFAWPGGESYVAFRRRALRALGDIAARHAGQRVVVVTHTGVVSQVLGALHGLSPARWDTFRPGNTAITEVRWEGAAGSVVRFDDRRHLAGLSGPPEGVGAADDPQLVASGAGRLGAHV